MRIKLLLISLRDRFLDSDRVMPPIGIMSLQSYITSKGFSCNIENDFDFNNTSKYACYTHFGISCMTPQKDEALDVLYAIKNVFPEKKVIIGGPHPTFYLEDCIKESFDYIVTGDGEFALESILLQKDNLGRVLNQPVSEKEMNLFPLPYRESNFLKQYNFDIQGLSASTILTAKGCPMGCRFCEDAGTKVRLYTPERVDRQIEQILKAGYESVMFFDDIFTLSMKRVRELTEVIKRHNIYFRCFGHARSLTNEMAEMLADAGCIEIGFGAESGAQEILDRIDKRTTVGQNRNFVEVCNKNGIKVKAFILLGLPGENHKTLSKTEDFLSYLMEHKISTKAAYALTNDFDITVFFPYKGTCLRKMIDECKENIDLFFSKDPESYIGVYKGRGGYADTVVRTSALSAFDIAQAQKSMLEKYKAKVCVPVKVDY